MNQMPDPNSPEVAWAAGLFEGEGTAWFGASTAKPNTSRLVLAIGMTDLDVLVRFQEVVGRGTVRGPYKRPAGQKPMYRWQISRYEDAVAVANLLRPWLLSRRAKQIDNALARGVEYQVRHYGNSVACGRGHPREGDNFYTNAKGYRICRVCRREDEQRRRVAA